MTISKTDRTLEELSQEIKEKGVKSQAAKLVQLIEKKQGVTLFHNDLDEPYIRIPMGEHFEIWPCKSKPFSRWAAGLFWNSEEEKVISSNALSAALNVIESKACYEGEKIELANRVCWRDGSIWYDLSDKEWRAVKIDKNGWEIVEKPPILFRRYKHQQAQAEPETGGDVKKLLEVVNISNRGENILFLVYIISCFIPDFPHPIINIYGQAGSAKTSLSILLKKLIDPSSIEEDDFPRSASEIAQKLSHNWYNCFGNVSLISEYISNLLCKAVTGASFSKRELYTDDEDIIHKFRRCICINGVSLAISMSDLLERTILLKLEKIPKDRRKEEKEIWKEFEKQKPMILGSIFSAVSEAIKRKDQIVLDSLPRMADFALWGCAIAEAIGYKKEDFLKAYNNNIDIQNKEVIYENLEANLLIEFMNDKGGWEGTPTQLLNDLRAAAEKQGTRIEKEKSFPKTANVLTRRLNLLMPNLEEAGIKIWYGEEDKRRMIYIQKVQENTDSTAGLSSEAENSDELVDDNEFDLSSLPFQQEVVDSQ